MTKVEPNIWRADFYRLSELFNPIIPSLHQLKYHNDRWPQLWEYQSLLDSYSKPIVNAQKKPIKFVNQSTHCHSFHEQYEPRIFLTGEVQTRLNNWHDFFQVLVWHSFPKTKIMLNALHYHASTTRLKENSKNKQRTTLENFLTLFDECGVIVVSRKKNLLELIENFQWGELFWENRKEFGSSIECFTFGHAMYEKALSPYIGMTANALLISVNEEFFNLNYENKLLNIDDIIIKKLNEENPLSPKTLNPFPILGVPNWYEKNNSLDFYLNEKYFRKGRKKK